MVTEDDLATPIRVVSARDEALDWLAMERDGVTPQRYAETRDETAVRVFPGKHPRWFVLRPLSGADCLTIESAPNEAARYWQAFQASVAVVENFAHPGDALRPTHPAPAHGGGTRFIWDPDDLQRVADALGMRAIYEIGGIALERAMEGNGRSGGVLFTPPLFLQLELDRIARRLAALARANAGTTSSGRSAPGQATTSSGSSGAVTDAPAASGEASPAAKAPTTSRGTKASSSSSRSRKRRAKG